jgi:hypothetical protein
MTGILIAAALIDQITSDRRGILWGKPAVDKRALDSLVRDEPALVRMRRPILARVALVKGPVMVAGLIFRMKNTSFLFRRHWPDGGPLGALVKGPVVMVCFQIKGRWR